MRGGHAARAALIQAYRCYLTNGIPKTPPIGCTEATALVSLRSIQQASDGSFRSYIVQASAQAASDGTTLVQASSWTTSPCGDQTAAAGLQSRTWWGGLLSQQHWPGGCQSARTVHSSSALMADVEVKVPPMGESITEGTVASVLVKPGDAVKEDDIIAQIETDKVTVDVKYIAKEHGVIRQILVKEQDTVTVGQSVVVVEQGAAPAVAAPEQVKETVSTPAPTPASAPPKQPEAQAPAPAAAQAAPAAAPTGPAQRPVRRVKMTRLRLRVAERLKGAQNTYAMLTTFNEVDMTSLMNMRNEFKDLFLEKHGVKMGFMSAFVKATASALQLVPAVNGVIDGTDIVYRDYVDISIAVATPKGLVVPVIRNADQLSFADVERTMNTLAKKARDGTISIDEMAGGTFTISNGGVYGSMLSTPIINPPQSAILGMHNIQKRAWVVGDKIEPRPIMYIALTYDHRLIDGREAVTFLKRIKEVVEDPRRLLLDV